jgi:hypothetical protein
MSMLQRLQFGETFRVACHSVRRIQVSGLVRHLGGRSSLESQP